ncbi:cytochrome c oxidase subunit 7C [Colletes latitarsis]|uniref:cytochrome c oxidase subunit 7C n=1 Tax=Colletes latitarsis TaxID=2605962 RepID=UPI004037255E
MISRHVRTFVTSAVRRSSHGDEGFPGANLPFSIKNKYMITALFTVYFGSGLALPYVILRHQLLK